MCAYIYTHIALYMKRLLYNNNPYTSKNTPPTTTTNTNLSVKTLQSFTS